MQFDIDDINKALENLPEPSDASTSSLEPLKPFKPILTIPPPPPSLVTTPQCKTPTKSMEALKIEASPAKSVSTYVHIPEFLGLVSPFRVRMQQLPLFSLKHYDSIMFLVGRKLTLFYTFWNTKIIIPCSCQQGIVSIKQFDAIED